MSQGQGVKLGGGEQGSHQVLFVSHPQPLLAAVCVCGCVCVCVCVCVVVLAKKLDGMGYVP